MPVITLPFSYALFRLPCYWHPKPICLCYFGKIIGSIMSQQFSKESDASVSHDLRHSSLNKSHITKFYSVGKKATLIIITHFSTSRCWGILIEIYGLLRQPSNKTTEAWDCHVKPQLFAQQPLFLTNHKLIKPIKAQRIRENTHRFKAIINLNTGISGKSHQGDIKCWWQRWSVQTNTSFPDLKALRLCP